ncbi:unnamed protein product, partial [Mycena citricolor]
IFYAAPRNASAHLSHRRTSRIIGDVPILGGCICHGPGTIRFSRDRDTPRSLAAIESRTGFECHSAEKTFAGGPFTLIHQVLRCRTLNELCDLGRQAYVRFSARRLRRPDVAAEGSPSCFPRPGSSKMSSLHAQHANHYQEMNKSTRARFAGDGSSHGPKHNCQQCSILADSHSAVNRGCCA